MQPAELLILFASGFIGGIMNTVAGGGTFVTFPTLVFIGIPPVAANASATVAALPGYLAGSIGFRREVLTFDRPRLRRMTLWMLLGCAIGALLLRMSSNAAFSVLVPFLLLWATLAFLFGDRIRSWAAGLRGGVTAFGVGSMLPVAIYGGYFNGGLGIVLLALFALWGMTDLNVMNGLKTWISFAMSMVAGLVFTVLGLVYWGPTVVMMLGTVAGGYLGAPVARRLPRRVLRAIIAAVGFGMTILFFIRLF